MFPSRRPPPSGQSSHMVSHMNDPQPNNPLHGITLKMMVTQLYEHFGWEELGNHINVRCFTSDPSISSSLKFLRKTPWARKKVEDLFLATCLPVDDRSGSSPPAKPKGKNGMQ